jgi:hypothetical protein
MHILDIGKRQARVGRYSTLHPQSQLRVSVTTGSWELGDGELIHLLPMQMRWIVLDVEQHECWIAIHQITVLQSRHHSSLLLLADDVVGTLLGRELVGKWRSH